MRGEIERVADFLGKSLSGEQLARLVAHLHFENFAKNESVNFEAGKQMGFMNQEGRFIRKGIHHYLNLTQLFRDNKKNDNQILLFEMKGETGDWKNHFSPELNDRIDQWIEKNLAGTDLKFVTELR